MADSVRATGAEIADLHSAAVPDSGVGLSPDDVLQPLARGLLRPMSAAWRGHPEAALAAAAASARRIAELRGTVRVLEPPSPYALGTSDAPLLVTIGNGLPFTVRVRLEISSTSGLRVAPIEMQQVPPLGRRQARVSAQVTRSGQFTVQAAVRSPDGELLGPPSRLRVRSTAYGTITVWLTASAGILLVVLAVRRVFRRVRIEPPPHTGPIPVHPGRRTRTRRPDRGTRRPRGRTQRRTERHRTRHEPDRQPSTDSSGLATRAARGLGPPPTGPPDPVPAHRPLPSRHPGSRTPHLDRGPVPAPDPGPDPTPDRTRVRRSRRRPTRRDRASGARPRRPGRCGPPRPRPHPRPGPPPPVRRPDDAAAGDPTRRTGATDPGRSGAPEPGPHRTGEQGPGPTPPPTR